MKVKSIERILTSDINYLFRKRMKEFLDNFDGIILCIFKILWIFLYDMLFSTYAYRGLKPWFM